MTPQQANELLPCAHCAGVATIINMNASTSWQYWMAACECGIQYEGPTAEDCTEMWNRRAPAPTSEPGARDLTDDQIMDIAEPFHDVGGVRFDEVAFARALLAMPLPTTALAQMSHENTKMAIEGAITYGRMGINPPPSPDHWLAQFWSIGQQLAKLGETSAWDNVTAADPAPLVAQVSPELPVLPKLPGPLYRHPQLGEMFDRMQMHMYASKHAEWLAKIIDAYQKAAPEASPLVEDAQRIVAGKVESTGGESGA